MHYSDEINFNEPISSAIKSISNANYFKFPIDRIQRKNALICNFVAIVAVVVKVVDVVVVCSIVFEYFVQLRLLLAFSAVVVYCIVLIL